jgi:hypothetical protein
MGGRKRVGNKKKGSMKKDEEDGEEWGRGIRR